MLADTMGDVFPEIRARKKQVQETIQREEESFNKTLDRGIEIFGEYVWIDTKLTRLSSEVIPIINQLLTGFQSRPNWTRNRQLQFQVRYKRYSKPLSW